MAKVKALALRALKRVLRAGRVVLHDPVVRRQGKKLAGILVIRGVVALGASAATVNLIRQILAHFGVG